MEGVLLNELVESVDILSRVEESIFVVSLLTINDSILLFNNFLVFRNCLLNLIRSFKSKIPAKELAETSPRNSNFAIIVFRDKESTLILTCIDFT